MNVIFAIVLLALFFFFYSYLFLKNMEEKNVAFDKRKKISFDEFYGEFYAGLFTHESVHHLLDLLAKGCEVDAGKILPNDNIRRDLRPIQGLEMDILGLMSIEVKNILSRHHGDTTALLDIVTVDDFIRKLAPMLDAEKKAA